MNTANNYLSNGTYGLSALKGSINTVESRNVPGRVNMSRTTINARHSSYGGSNSYTAFTGNYLAIAIIPSLSLNSYSTYPIYISVKMDNVLVISAVSVYANNYSGDGPRSIIIGESKEYGPAELANISMYTTNIVLTGQTVKTYWLPYNGFITKKVEIAAYHAFQGGSNMSASIPIYVETYTLV